ncbi:MAG: hypothetical protein K8I03_01025 [Ignavibacteria bacterium]|nr:hypothetical protein [Ignavibacteria bacterium]
MIWFIVAVAIFVLIGSMVDFSCNGWNVTKQFFTDSWWGIIAIASGLLSLFMFYGSSKSYRDVKINETFLPNPDKLQLDKKKGSIPMSKNNTEIMEFDLSQLTMNVLTKKMAFVMTKPGPVFFKGWGNRRLELDVERVEIIREYIEAIRSTGDSLIHLHADSVLSFEKMENLVKIKRKDLMYQLRESELKLDLLEQEYQTKIEKLHLDIANLETLVYEKISQIENLNAQTEQILSEIRNRSKEVDADIKIKKDTSESDIKVKEEESRARIQLEKDKAKAEIFIMKLKAGDDSAISKKRATALDMVIKEMNIDNITPTEVYLLIKLLDTNNTNDFLDFTNKMKVMEEELEKMRIQNEILKADAKERKAKANETEAQSKQNIKDLYSNK